jgi:hypothetical protein
VVWAVASVVIDLTGKVALVGSREACSTSDIPARSDLDTHLPDFEWKPSLDEKPKATEIEARPRIYKSGIPYFKFTHGTF